MKTFKNRIEGTTVEQHGNPDISLLGIHRSLEQFGRNATLSVRFFLPARTGQGSRKVAIEARELFDTEHYLMAAKSLNWTENAWQVFTPWPTRDIIDTLQLVPTNLGVLASFRDGNSEPVYMPVDVFTTTIPAPDHYVVWFRASRDFHALDRSVLDSAGHKMVAKKSLCRASPDCTLYAATTAHSVEFDFSGYPDGVYNVNLTGSVPNSSDKQTLSFSLLHHRKTEGN